METSELMGCSLVKLESKLPTSISLPTTGMKSGLI